jgi:hypothetical protein
LTGKLTIIALYSMNAPQKQPWNPWKWPPVKAKSYLLLLLLVGPLAAFVNWVIYNSAITGTIQGRNHKTIDVSASPFEFFFVLLIYLFCAPVLNYMTFMSGKTLIEIIFKSRSTSK